MNIRFEYKVTFSTDKDNKIVGDSIKYFRRLMGNDELIKIDTRHPITSKLFDIMMQVDTQKSCMYEIEAESKMVMEATSINYIPNVKDVEHDE